MYIELDKYAYRERRCVQIDKYVDSFKYIVVRWIVEKMNLDVWIVEYLQIFFGNKPQVKVAYEILS